MRRFWGWDLEGAGPSPDQIAGIARGPVRPGWSADVSCGHGSCPPYLTEPSESSQAGAHVWVADSSARKARLKTVKLGQGIRGDLVEVVEGLNAGLAPAIFFFDKESGLLVRVVRYADSPVGRIPMQTDYADYREVSGVKMPFRWTTTWLDGRSTIELREVQVNVPVAAVTFAKPVR